MKICHITSVHSCDDVRVFHKECKGLSKNFDSVHLMAPEAGYEKIDGVSLISLVRRRSRLSRFFKSPFEIFIKARRMAADVYHLHDPELIPLGIIFRIFGAKVIYDAHEDIELQILTKAWISQSLRKPVAFCVVLFLRCVLRFYSGIVVATPAIRSKYQRMNSNVIAIANYPILYESVTKKNVKEDRTICYIGGLTKRRGLFELIRALEGVNAKLDIAGNFEENCFYSEVKSMPGWSKVKFHGYLDRASVQTLLSYTSVGIVTLHPMENYLESLPVKMFEYMAAGLPVVASNFPLWREIVEKQGCGLCVDPLDVEAISNAIDYLLSNPKVAKQMGTKGRDLVEAQYNWANEERALAAC